MSENIREPLFNLLHSVKRTMRNNTNLSDYGLTLLHLRVLKIIHADDKQITANDIVQKTLIDKAQLARLIKELLTLDYIIKLDNPKDRRSYYLRLTPTGVAIIQMLTAVELQMNDVMKGSLTDNEINEFKRIAKVMADNLNHHL